MSQLKSAHPDTPGSVPTTFHQRKSPRAEFHDYSGGNYFVTICTRDKKHYFGKIIDGKMHYSELGNVANQKLATLEQHYRYVEVPLYVVMPNHIHIIIHIQESAATHGPIPQIRSLLSVAIGGYKQSVTMYARRHNIDFGWQGRYHDHIIRGLHDGNTIAEYIRNNPSRWDTDCFNTKT